MGDWRPRRLSQREKAACRALWEEIFTEDSGEFLDYYDRWKAADNECYGIFDGDRLVSMLELNPYRLRVKGCLTESRYVIAVATRPEYRHRGMMKSLLAASLEDMRKRGMPFVFLMPASEAIYRPFGFRYFYEMHTGKLPPAGSGPEDPAAGERLFARTAAEEDISRLTEFSGAVLPFLSDLYAERDAGYYRTLLAELVSEGGGLLMLEEAGKLRGLIPYWGEEETEIREILCLPQDKEAVLGAAEQYFARTGRKEPVPVNGAAFPMEGKKPVIMGRAVNIPAFLELFGEPEEAVEFRLSDPLLEANNQIFRWGGERELSAASLEGIPSCTEAELFSWLAAGGPAPEGMPETEGCRAAFLNEIV